MGPFAKVAGIVAMAALMRISVERGAEAAAEWLSELMAAAFERGRTQGLLEAKEIVETTLAEHRAKWAAEIAARDAEAVEPEDEPEKEPLYSGKVALTVDVANATEAEVREVGRVALESAIDKLHERQLHDMATDGCRHGD